jgi:uncharacterized protein YegP (UPF0339 family)
VRPTHEFEIYHRADGLYDWRLVARANGEIVATSGGQGFRDVTDTRRAIDALIEANPLGVTGPTNRPAITIVEGDGVTPTTVHVTVPRGDVVDPETAED